MADKGKYADNVGFYQERISGGRVGDEYVIGLEERKSIRAVLEYYCDQLDECQRECLLDELVCDFNSVLRQYDFYLKQHNPSRNPTIKNELNSRKLVKDDLLKLKQRVQEISFALCGAELSTIDEEFELGWKDSWANLRGVYALHQFIDIVLNRLYGLRQDIEYSDQSEPSHNISTLIILSEKLEDSLSGVWRKGSGRLSDETKWFLTRIFDGRALLDDDTDLVGWSPTEKIFIKIEAEIDASLDLLASGPGQKPQFEQTIIRRLTEVWFQHTSIVPTRRNIANPHSVDGNLMEGGEYLMMIQTLLSRARVFNELQPSDAASPYAKLVHNAIDDIKEIINKSNI